MAVGHRKLMVTSCEVIKEGTGKNNKPYTMYEVFAVDEAGAPVEAKLRSFSALELNTLVDYKIEQFASDRHGISYTLIPPGQERGNRGGGGGGLGASVDALRKKVDELDRRLRLLEGTNPGSQSAPTGPTSAGAGSPGAGDRPHPH